MLIPAYFEEKLPAFNMRNGPLPGEMHFSFGQEPVGKTLLERSIVFYRKEAGDLVAMQNRCLHRSFPLSKGFREGDNLVCRYHGIRYAPDGSLARVPCQDRLPN